MPRPMVRHRSSSGGSGIEIGGSNQTPSIHSGETWAAEELFRIVTSLKDARGKSFLHSIDTPDSMALAQSLLQRGAWLDSQARDSNEPGRVSIQDRLCLQSDIENGYTPLHGAIFDGNLAGILLLLRQAVSSASAVDGFTLFGTGQERLKHRPMQLLQDEHSVDQCLVRRMVQAMDHEGLTPLQLMGNLQTGTLAACRISLASRHSQVQLQSSRRRSSSVYSLEDEDQDPDSELSLLTRGLHLLHGDREYEEDDSGSSALVIHGCEVLTFGRANHCALGVPRSDATASHPQRVAEFALSQVGVANSAVQVDAAAHHSMVVTREGHLYACGLNKGGRLGTGDDRNRVSFTRVLGSLTKRKVIHVAAAVNHSLCCTQDGNVYGFGSNRFGQLGVSNATANGTSMEDGGGSRSFSPRRVEGLRNIPCVRVAAGDKHSVALGRIGEVFTFGDNCSGQLGRLGRRVGAVQRVDSLWKAQPCKVVVDIAASEQSTLVIVSPVGNRALPVNSVYSWGHGNHRPIKANFADDKASTQTHDASLHRRDRRANPVAIACAKYHNAVITDDGRVYTFGISAESLGTRGSRDVSPSIIGSPQLVEGMLPENGGGRVVSVSASEHHTAVVTSTGHVFSWGVSQGTDVLGHQDRRWQPTPKKIPGVHRAVGLACAKEHTVLLIGTSFPPVPRVDESCSLEARAAREVAQHVDLFNIIPVLVMAHRVESSLLKRYCNDFVRKNLDGVMTLGRKSEMNTFLHEQLADGSHLSEMSACDLNHHPLIFRLVTAGCSSRYEEADAQAWLGACDNLLDGLPPSIWSLYRGPRHGSTRNSMGSHGRNRALSIQAEGDEQKPGVTFHSATKAMPGSFVTCSERCLMLTANMMLKTPENVRSKSCSLMKEIRSVRKRLGQIARLGDANPNSLTIEQREKLTRKPLLEADLAMLEQAMMKVEAQTQELGLEQKTLAYRVPEDVAPAHAKKKSEPCPSESHTSESSHPEEQDKEHRAAQVLRCEICSVTCPDAKSLALHRSGRKHRNRVLQSEESECKQAADSIMAEKHRQALVEGRVPTRLQSPKRGQKDAWGSSAQPRYRLPPPPHFPVSRDGSNAISSRACKVNWAVGPKSAARAPKLDFQGIVDEEAKKLSSTASPPSRSPTAPRTLPSPGSLPPLKLPPWASPVARVAASSPESVSFSTFTANPRRKSHSLGDFIPSPPSKSEKIVTPPWSASPAKKAASATTHRPKGLHAIQQEEEAFREKQHKSYGVEGKWFIERKERAGSFSAIQEAETKEYELQLQIEEQRQIEAQIALEIEDRRKKNGKDSKHKRRKPFSREKNKRSQRADSEEKHEKAKS